MLLPGIPPGIHHCPFSLTLVNNNDNPTTPLRLFLNLPLHNNRAKIVLLLPVTHGAPMTLLQTSRAVISDPPPYERPSTFVPVMKLKRYGCGDGFQDTKHGNYGAGALHACGLWAEGDCAPSIF